MKQIKRNRRLRNHSSIRDLVRENHLLPSDFIVPIFMVEGKGVREEIPSMPGYFRWSLDRVTEEVKELWHLGLRAVLLFAKIPPKLKDNQGKEALNTNGLMQRGIRTIKNAVPDMLVMTDVALDPYSIYGHDGVVAQGQIQNDQTCQILAQIACAHAESGADFVAPSDMMDGRIQAIRLQLEEANYPHTGIMSYSAKYASSFYGPFRDVLDSAPVYHKDIPTNKKSYQMDFANRKEAIKEILMDIDEGADIVMIKPGICYLDILSDAQAKTNVPVAVYQVSGEYAMLKAAANQGFLDYEQAMLEQLFAFKRAGAQLIASYFAKEAVQLLRK